MQIQHSVEGGVAYFPGLAKPNTVNIDDLPDDTARELHGLITGADFFNLPSVVGTSPKGIADARTHTLTVEDGKRSHTVKIIEPVGNPQLKDLLKKVSILRPAGK